MERLSDRIDKVRKDIVCDGYDHYPEITYDELEVLFQLAHKIRLRENEFVSTKLKQSN